jgi:arylsulfatase A
VSGGSFLQERVTLRNTNPLAQTAGGRFNPRMVRIHFSLLLTAILFAAPLASRAADAKPNFVIIFADDQGYGDLGCFGSTKIKTPNIDRLATEGRRFTNFMVASPVCTPSRAALLTGCYPKRVGLHQHVLFPTSTKGLNPDEHTIADHLKGQGYATAAFGKWHLGHHPETLPQQNGFDTYFGIPYSNDMNHPDNKSKPMGGAEGMDLLWNDPGSTLTKWNTPLMENEKIVELPVDQRTVTRRYTQKAIDFIKDNYKEKPFFVYLPHSMPHIPLYVPDDVRDPNPLNAYTNTIEHIDSEVGRLMDTIRELDLSGNTYVIYTTDNGPWLTFKHHGGSAGPLRDGKGTTFEGGQRVPCVMWGPGRIPANTETSELMGTIDLLPTIATLTGTPLPTKNKIDGLDASALVLGTGSSPRSEFLYYTSQGVIEGLRQGKWKLLVKQKKVPKNAKPNAVVPEPEILLFDLQSDIGEATNLAEANPDTVTALTKRMTELDAEITANARSPWFKPGTEN